MELEELKNVWTSVDERLKKQEILNARIVQKMLKNKSSRLLSKLINLEIFGIIVLLLAIPVCIYAFNLPHIVNTFFPTITLVVGLVICVFGIILGCYTLQRYLTKIDFSKNVKDNMHYVNKYKILYRRGKLVNYCIIIPVISLLLILSRYEITTPFYLWIFLVVALISMIAFTVWMYKRVYEKSIQSIQKNLEELEELEE